VELEQEYEGLLYCMLHRGASRLPVHQHEDLDCDLCPVITDCPLAPVFDNTQAMLVLAHIIKGPPLSETGSTREP
jgi:hypothetical protein